MNKLSKILTAVILVQLAIATTFGYYILHLRAQIADLKEDRTSFEVTSEESEDEEISVAELKKVNLDINVGGHLVWWDQDRGYETIQKYGNYFTYISPFWYELTIEEKIQPFSGAEDQRLIDFLRLNRIKITPVISNEFSVEPLASIIADSQKTSQHIEDITELAKNYDGISLNYENLNASDKGNFSSFVTNLAEELHKENKTLSVHLHAKTGEPGSWNGPQAQDWQALGKVCDRLKIMAYDYHWSTSEAGAIAPPDWVEDVIKHALTLIPKEKIYLGIPLYGYDWIGKAGEGITHGEAIILVNLNNVTIYFDDTTKSNFFTYTDKDDNLHEVWFESEESVSYKLQLSKQYDLGGIDFWRLGDEDNKVWQKVEDTFKSE